MRNLQIADDAQRDEAGTDNCQGQSHCKGNDCITLRVHKIWRAAIWIRCQRNFGQVGARRYSCHSEEIVRTLVELEILYKQIIIGGVEDERWS